MISLIASMVQISLPFLGLSSVAADRLTKLHKCHKEMLLHMSFAYAVGTTRFMSHNFYVHASIAHLKLLCSCLNALVDAHL